MSVNRLFDSIERSAQTPANGSGVKIPTNRLASATCTATIFNLGRKVPVWALALLLSTQIFLDVFMAKGLLTGSVGVAIDWVDP
jgi:hypothetical protein